MQPIAYDYLGHLKKHMNLEKVFNDELVYPRQLQIYMPGGCNFKCYYCAGRHGKVENIHWEERGLEFLDKLGDRIPYHMYSGSSTEPTLNPYFLKFLEATKRNGCCFGVKTNGSKLVSLESKQGFLTRLCEISTSFNDFISISLDAGYAKSHAATKRSKPNVFEAIIEGIEMLCSARGDRPYPAIRISYLLNECNDSHEELERAIQIAETAGVDSIRFSQPHPAYLEDGEIADAQWRYIEQKDKHYMDLFEKLCSVDNNVAFYAPPFTKVDLQFAQCAYGYYQMTLSQDSYFYKCTTVVGIPDLRLGMLTSDMDEFDGYIRENQNSGFDPARCIHSGAYCCRAAVAVNKHFEGNS